MANVKGNLNELNRIMKGLKDDYTVRIGILGSDAGEIHTGSSLTNAEIGTFHEFGTSKMPRRSFLEEPLKAGLTFDQDEMRDMKKLLWKQFFVKGSPEAFMEKLMYKALSVIKASWNAGGNPAWQSLTANTLKQKAKKNQSPAILTATTQLRNSISGVVMKGKTS